MTEERAVSLCCPFSFPSRAVQSQSYEMGQTRVVTKWGYAGWGGGAVDGGC